MNLNSFLLVISGVLLNAIAQLALKASVREMGPISVSVQTAPSVALRMAAEPWLWVGLVCYGVSVIVWILALSRVDVTLAYPKLSIGYIVTAIVAWLWLGEVLTVMRLSGIGFIIIGVVLLTRG